jgi:hypothetical protein
LTELRSWIASRNQQPPATVSLPAAVPPQASGSTEPQTAVMAQRLQSVSPPPSSKNVAECQSAVSSEPTETLLSEVKKEGHYVLLCKVNNIFFIYLYIFLHNLIQTVIVFTGIHNFQNWCCHLHSSSSGRMQR